MSTASITVVAYAPEAEVRAAYLFALAGGRDHGSFNAPNLSRVEFTQGPPYPPAKMPRLVHLWVESIGLESASYRTLSRRARILPRSI